MLLILRAWMELLRHDLTLALFGFRAVHRGLGRLKVSRRSEITASEIHSAVAAAMVLYWKPVRCLQQSVVTTRLMRRNGWNGRLVIGYRAEPFFSHAWVEMDGSSLEGSKPFRERLHILETI